MGPTNIGEVKERLISTAEGRLDGAMNALSEAIDHVRYSFHPVLGPDEVKPTEEAKAPSGSISSFDALVDGVERRIRAKADELHELARRSRV
jgi:hypothetical protein